MTSGRHIHVCKLCMSVMLIRRFTLSTMRCVHDCSSLRLVRLVSRWTASLSSTAVTDISCSLLRNGERRHCCRGHTLGIINLALYLVKQFCSSRLAY